MFCQKCGNSLDNNAYSCPKCGCPTGNVASGKPPKKRTWRNYVTYASFALLIFIVLVCAYYFIVKPFVISMRNVSSQYSNSLKEEYDFSISIDRWVTEIDDEGDTILLVTYKFINNTNEPKAFIYMGSITTYQNGIGLSKLYYHSTVDLNGAMNKVQPNTPYFFTQGYELRNTTTPVEVEITGWATDELFYTYNIDLD